MPSNSASCPDFCGARVSGAGKLLPPRGWLLPRRVLPEDALLYVHRGRGEITIGERVLPVRREHVYLVPREVVHLARAAPAYTIEHWYVHFTLLDAAGAPVPLAGLGLPEMLPAPGSLEGLFLQCARHVAARDAAGQAALAAAFFALLERLLRAAAPGAEGDAAEGANGRARHTAPVMLAIEWMMENVEGDVTLEELAAGASMSPSHFEKVFKRVTGSAPHAYYNGLKMERAKTLMAAGEGTLTHLAGALGFGSLHHFSRTFKRYEGESPSGYLRRLRAGATVESEAS